MPRINTNVTALNAQRVLGQANRDFGRTAGRLASGFRINRAADDAAGLGIANRLRANIGGLQQASRNAEQANSLLQVAEGGIQQIEGILERMKELATQSASDNVSTQDRTLIQDEFAELQEELDRIVDTTKFQGSNLLDGTFGAQTSLATGAGNLSNAAGVTVSVTGDFDASAAFTVTNNANVLTITNDATSEAQSLAYTDSTAATLNFDALGISVALESSVTDASLDTAITTNGDDAVAVTVAAGGEFLVSSSGNVTNDTITIDAIDLQGATLAVDSGSVSVSSKTGAETALSAIDSAIDTVSAAFGDIGAAQNRLDFASANVDTQIENFSAAESVIRDADIAEESTTFARLQIQQQAATAILAQANSAPQQVLQLLQ